MTLTPAGKRLVSKMYYKAPGMDEFKIVPLGDVDSFTLTPDIVRTEKLKMERRLAATEYSCSMIVPASISRALSRWFRKISKQVALDAIRGDEEAKRGLLPVLPDSDHLRALKQHPRSITH